MPSISMRPWAPARCRHIPGHASRRDCVCTRRRPARGLKSRRWAGRVARRPPASRHTECARGPLPASSFAGGMQAEERRAFLDGQLIQRQMFGGFRDGELELAGPHLRRLVRSCINQIERVAIERAARDGDGIERFARAMQASSDFIDSNRS